MKNMLTKITNSFPVFGGGAGAVISETHSLPNHDMILSTIILAVIGSVVGYLVKLLFDWVIKKVRKNK